MQIIVDYATGAPRYKVIGGGDSGDAVAVSMTTAERTAITPDAGVMIWDTDLNKLFVGDGNTAGGVEVQGGGGDGTVTGIEASVSGGTATITATGSTTSVKLTGTDGVAVKGNTNTGAVELDAKDLSDGTQSITKDLKNARFVECVNFGTVSVQNALTLLHFSDLHHDADAMSRIKTDRDEMGEMVQDVICTGDMVRASSEYLPSWWEPSFLTVIGNHECFNGSNWRALSMSGRISNYIAPFESNWGITRPEGKDWYYKDYPSQKVRLIAIDCMWYDASGADIGDESVEQTAWVVDLLASAITAGYHVVIATHAPRYQSPTIPCSFTQRSNKLSTAPSTICTIPTPIISAVATAKSNGLKFVGYICGHTHIDLIDDVCGDGSQYAYCVTCANVNMPGQDISWQWASGSDQYRDSTLDAYNLVTIDTAHTTVAIVRGGGANVDVMMREREAISINYGTGEVIDREIPSIRNGFRSEYEAGIQNVARYIATDIVAGSTVTLQAGHAYRADVIGTLTLNMETPPFANAYGLDGLLDLTLDGGMVTAGENVILADELSANNRNICSVRYVNGLAVVNVLTVVALPPSNYNVTVTSGTGDGSLYAGLTGTKITIMFDPATNGQTISVVGAETGASKTIVGNGVANTIITGDIAFAYPAVVSSLALNGASITGTDVALADVGVTGGTMTLGSGTTIPAGATMLISSGAFVTLSGTTVDGTVTSYDVPYSGLALENVTGSGTFDLNSTTVFAKYSNLNGVTLANGQFAYLQGAVITNVIISGFTNTETVSGGFSGFANINAGANGGGVASGCSFVDNVYKRDGINVGYGCQLVDCVLSGNSCNNRGFMTISHSSTNLIDRCTIDSNTVQNGELVVCVQGATVTIRDSYLGTNQRFGGISADDTLIFDGSNTILGYSVAFGGADFVIKSGAILNLTGNTVSTVFNRTSSGSIIVEGDCTVINSAGVSSTITGGTYTAIKKDGTTIPPQE